MTKVKENKVAKKPATKRNRFQKGNEKALTLIPAPIKEKQLLFILQKHLRIISIPDQQREVELGNMLQEFMLRKFLTTLLVGCGILR